MKRIFIIHGFNSYPDDCWFPWLKKELENIGFEVVVPYLPNPNEPTIDSWLLKIREVVGIADQNTFFVGHSLGCQAIMRYVESLNTQIGGMVLVAPFIKLKYLSKDLNKNVIMRPWVDTDINFKDILKNTKNIHAIFSDNDKFIDLENIDLFKERLGAFVTIDKNQGHFSSYDKVFSSKLILNTIYCIHG
jgi:predicted alpha/beta hydrolase family esterase